MVGTWTQSSGKGVGDGEDSGRIYRSVERFPGRPSIGNGSGLMPENVGWPLKEKWALKKRKNPGKGMG